MFKSCLTYFVCVPHWSCSPKKTYFGKLNLKGFMRQVICKGTVFCFFYILRVLKFIRERFLRAGAPYEIHPSIRKKWGINNPSSVNAERLLLISTKIVDPLCKYWYISFHIRSFRGAFEKAAISRNLFSIPSSSYLFEINFFDFFLGIY